MLQQIHKYFLLLQKCKLTQGKIFGGSSKLNNMVHVRGNTSHYVEWFHGKYTKNYIEEQFDYINSNIFHLNSIQYESDLSEAVLNASKELNFNLLNKKFDIGFNKSLLTQNNGKRWTTSYNLETSKHVLTNVLVEKLLFKGSTCIGVQIHSANKVKLFAKKGVIVSAGTFNSAKILQLSGIGPRTLLDSLDIPVKKELPVGKNLQDHIGTGLDLVLFNNSQSVGMFDIMNLWNVFQYFFNGKGPLTTPGCEVVGFVSTKNETTPDLQFMVLPVGISTDRGSYLRKALRIKDSVWENYFSKIFDKYSATFLTLLLHPKSKGEVRIQSSDPNMPPLINPKYLSHKDDIRTIAKGVLITRKLIETESLKAMGAHINNLPFPGCENFEMFSDLYLECYIKHLTLTSYHPVGTCTMGLPNSNKSVVDTSFRVIGIDNVYVVDGSVLPTLPSGNINAVIAMMANIFFDSNIMKLYNTNSNKSCDKIIFREFVQKICVKN